MDPFEYYRPLRKAKEYVAQRINEPIAIKDVADAANLSSSHFSTYFKSRVGCTFTEWLTAIRIDRAKMLLSTSDISVTAASFNAGFGSVSAFERAFKKLEGKTPQSFRKSVKRGLREISEYAE